MFYVRRSVQLQRHNVATECFLFAVDQNFVQVSRWVAMVFIVKKLLHRGTGVLAQVYAQSVVCTKQVS